MSFDLVNNQPVWVFVSPQWVPGTVERQDSVPLLKEGRYFVRLKKESFLPLGGGPIPLEPSSVGSFDWGIRKPRNLIHTEDEHAAYVLTV